MPPPAADELRHCFGAIETVVTGGITRQCNRARDAKFAIWTDFRQQYGKAEYLSDDENSMAWLLLFAYKVRCGELAYNGKLICSCSVEEYVLAVALAHVHPSYMSTPNPASVIFTSFSLPNLLWVWLIVHPGTMQQRDGFDQGVSEVEKSGGKGGGKGGGKVDTAYHKPNEWYKLSKEERNHILAKHGKDGSHKRCGSGGGGGGGGDGGRAIKWKLAALASDVIKELEESEEEQQRREQQWWQWW